MWKNRGEELTVGTTDQASGAPSVHYIDEHNQLRFRGNDEQTCGVMPSTRCYMA